MITLRDGDGDGDGASGPRVVLARLAWPGGASTVSRSGDPGAPVPVALLVALVGSGLAAVLAAAALASFWAAGLLLAVLLLSLAGARLVLPVAALGPLAVRSRWVDVTTCAVLGVSLAVLAVVAPR